MDEVFKDPVPLAKGVKVQDLLSGYAEFHLDLDFKKSNMGIMLDDDLYPDMDDGSSDSEDAYKNIEAEAEKHLLSCPEYHTFSDLASKMIDCIPSGEVKMLIIEEGDGPLVPRDAMCTLHYAAYFEKATLPFDSTLTVNNGAPMSLHLGRGRFLPGLEIGLTSVKGPKARFLLMLQPKMAWGELGAPPRIRPEPALFVIVLYDVDDIMSTARYSDLTSEEQINFKVSIDTVKSLHNHAKVLFTKKKNYVKAIKKYQQSINILNTTQTHNSDEENEVKRLKTNSYTNLAVCYYKLNKPKYVLHMCDALVFVTDVEKNCKVMFYNGRGHEMLGRYEEALKYYKKALKLEPKNTEIGIALAKLDKYNKMSADQERDLWENAFQCTSKKKSSFVYDVEDNYKDGVFEMCEYLAGSEHAKFDLPPGQTRDEIECLKDVCSQFENIVVLEEGEGSKKKVSVVKKSHV